MHAVWPFTASRISIGTAQLPVTGGYTGIRYKPLPGRAKAGVCSCWATRWIRSMLPRNADTGREGPVTTGDAGDVGPYCLLPVRRKRVVFPNAALLLSLSTAEFGSRRRSHSVSWLGPAHRPRTRPARGGQYTGNRPALIRLFAPHYYIQPSACSFASPTRQCNCHN